MLNKQSLDNTIVKQFIDRIDGEDEGRDDCINALVAFHESTLLQVKSHMAQAEKMIEKVKSMQ